MTRTSPEVRDCQSAALRYLRRGWAVVPIAPGAKMPLVPWEGYQDRAPDDAEVRGWYRRWPDAGVGIITGPVSHLVVLDVDPRHGGEESLFAWQERWGPLPPTLEAVTGGGGRHLYFTSADPGLRNRAGLLPGIDLRASGGLVVAPPSLHASGCRYAWRESAGPDKTPPLPLPRRLAHLLKQESRRRGQGAVHWRGLVRDGVAEGQRNDKIASLCGHLLWHGVDDEVALELLLAWNQARCRPPLPDDEVTHVVHSISKLHQRRGGGDES